MADLGDRVNVMGPQPIAPRKSPPPEMIQAAERILAALVSGDAAGLATMAAPAGARDVVEIAAATGKGRYDRWEIIASARINDHYFVKGRLHGADTEPFTLQFRIGKYEGRWAIWEAQDLNGGRTAWTR